MFIHKYVRNRKNQLVGVVLATKRPDSSIGIGWSRCCNKDTFDKKVGLEIANARAIKGSVVPLPNGFRSEVEQMANRATRYFKS